MLGKARAPIDPAQVQVYSNAPVGSVEIAQLESTSAAGFGTQGQTDAAVMRLKREAAKLGANGVVIVGVGSERSGGGLSVGGGSYGGRVGGGLGIGIPTTQKRAAGMAIWVPAGWVIPPVRCLRDKSFLWVQIFRQTTGIKGAGRSCWPTRAC